MSTVVRNERSHGGGPAPHGKSRNLKSRNDEVVSRAGGGVNNGRIDYLDWGNLRSWVGPQPHQLTMRILVGDSGIVVIARSTLTKLDGYKPISSQGPMTTMTLRHRKPRSLR
jgi:hypothetical protein